jgi:hypothetical protein
LASGTASPALSGSRAVKKARATMFDRRALSDLAVALGM